MTIEERFPITIIQQLAKIESQRRQFYRPIYSIHKSWARRPGTTIRAIGLSHFYQDTLFNSNHIEEGGFYQNHYFQGKIALDPFCGGGTSIVELHRLGIKTIGIDVNPIAWFTTKKELDSFNEATFNQEVKKIFQSVGQRIKSYYKTICPSCHYSDADIMYIFWVRTIQCPSCNSEEDLFKYYIIGKKQRKHKATMVICPSCDHLFYTWKKVKEISSCPECQHEFIPIQGNCRLKKFTCTHCQKESRLVEILQQPTNSFSARQIAIEFFCPECRTRDYKPVNKEDRNLFTQVQEEFMIKKDELLYPHELLPIEGDNISNLRNYGFQRFSDLFNERQLLSLSLLIQAISKVADQNIREFLLSAFSSCLEFHTVICPYNYTMKQIVNVFNYQSFLVPTMYVENNVWGTKKGNGTFITYLERIKKAKKYCRSPFEIAFQNNQIIRISVPGDNIEAKSVKTFQELQASSRAETLLINDSSENLQRLGIPKASVDIIVTDPPYFDYIQYSELANFFYVWLRIVLRPLYSEFHSNLINTEYEIGRLKQENHFLEGITKVFQECYRVLKPEGPMIFTFHHSSETAWAMILEALAKSQFLITATFPVRSEFGARPVKGQNFDFIIICRKYSKVNLAMNHISRTVLESEIKRSLDDFSVVSPREPDLTPWGVAFASILPMISKFSTLNQSVDIEEIILHTFTLLKNLKIQYNSKTP
ncbi:MAG: DNA methyltransferase [Promethearchaeota archaeon]